MIVKLCRNKFALFIVATILISGLTMLACTSEAPTPTPAETTTTKEEPKTEEPKTEEPKKEFVKLTLSSSAFTEGEPIPVKYSCDGENISPAGDLMA